MKRRTPHTAATLEVKIEKLVYGGSGLARHEGKVLFVPFTAPGDRARVRIDLEKKSYSRASVRELLEAGEGRVDPICRHFGICGGCQWQHLDYSRQLEIKREILRETLHHHLPESRDLEIAMQASPSVYGYRSRARVQARGFGKETRVGFFRSQSHRVEDIDHCPLLQPALNEGLAALREVRRRLDSDPGPDEVELVGSPEAGEWISASVRGAEGKVEGVQVPGPTLVRESGSFTFEVSPASFFQANDSILPALVERVRRLAQGTRGRTALELFSGIGLFTVELAGLFEKVTAVERSPEAALLCRMNARGAGRDNIRFICSDAADWMRAVGSAAPHACDLVLLDPPRTGAGTEVMARILEWNPESILYVSCDPNTLVRDLALLPQREYRIEYVEGFDLFPQTYHFETVVRMLRR